MQKAVPAYLEADSMAESAAERLSLELELLTSMYPDTLHFSEKARDLTFSSEPSSKDKLVLRLGQDYPRAGAPEVISARSQDGSDLRQQVQSTVKQACSEINVDDPDNPGEVLDAIIAAYLEVIASQPPPPQASDDAIAQSDLNSHKTVVIWLHHLLATSKRKLAIHPSISADQVRGVTKPGYPGVMVFSGVRSAVEDHVTELKSQNWQAFAVRYEADEFWAFEDQGVREVETMADAVKCIPEAKREIFLKAVGVK